MNEKQKEVLKKFMTWAGWPKRERMPKKQGKTPEEISADKINCEGYLTRSFLEGAEWNLEQAQIHAEVWFSLYPEDLSS